MRRRSGVQLEVVAGRLDVVDLLEAYRVDPVLAFSRAVGAAGPARTARADSRRRARRTGARLFAAQLADRTVDAIRQLLVGELPLVSQAALQRGEFALQRGGDLLLTGLAVQVMELMGIA